MQMKMLKKHVNISLLYFPGKERGRLLAHLEAEAFAVRPFLSADLPRSGFAVGNRSGGFGVHRPAHDLSRQGHSRGPDHDPKRRR